MVRRDGKKLDRIYIKKKLEAMDEKDEEYKIDANDIFIYTLSLQNRGWDELSIIPKEGPLNIEYF